MKGICVDVDFGTGYRAGGLNPRDPNLRCHPTWQNLKRGCEILLVLDENTQPYEEIEGVTVLHNEQEIQAALDEKIGERVQFSVASEAILSASLSSGRIKTDDLSTDLTECCEQLHSRGAAGVTRRVVTPHSIAMVHRKGLADLKDARAGA